MKLLSGIGPKKAIALIREHKNIETILTKIDQTKYPPPENWPYQEARKYVSYSYKATSNGSLIY